METVDLRRYYDSRGYECGLWSLGDLHIGSASTDEEAIRSTVKKIRDNPDDLWVGLGDLAEFINRSDKRHRESERADFLRDLPRADADDLAKAQEDRVVELLSPIKNQCLGLLEGNHEDRIHERYEHNYHRDICARLGVRRLPESAWITILFQRGKHGPVFTLDTVCHHGWFAGRKSGGKANNLHDMLLSYDCDCIMVGHGHERNAAPPLITMRRDATGALVPWRRYALMTGSFMRSVAQDVSSYASRKGYRPNDIGAVRLSVTPSTGELSVTV